MGNDLQSREIFPDGEIALLEVVQFFKDGLKTISLATVIFGSMGVVYALLAPTEYEAIANFQMAMVANAPVEQPAVLIEKIKLPLYFSSDIWNHCNEGTTAEPISGLVENLKSTQNKSAPFVIVSYRASTPKKAKECLENVVEEVRKKQREISEPIIAQKKMSLAILKLKLGDAENFSKLIVTQKPNFNFADAKFSAAALLLATSLNKENEIKDLRNQIGDLEMALSEPQTRGTYLAAPIYSPDKRVSPKRTLIVLMTTLLGLMFGIGYLLVANSWRGLVEKLK